MAYHFINTSMHKPNSIFEAAAETNKKMVAAMATKMEKHSRKASD
jgi:hypothetical protein